MRYKQGQKEQTRERILAAAGRSFRKGGYAGVGVDGLAKEAGVTSGAFYGHFSSKAEAFIAAISDGLEELRLGIASFQQENGKNWWVEFAKFYMGQKRTCDLSESCALQSLTSEVSRSDDATRKLFESELLKVVERASNCSKQKNDQKNLDRTWANLSMLIGGVTLARAVKSKKLSKEIAMAIEKSISSIENDS